MVGPAAPAGAAWKIQAHGTVDSTGALVILAMAIEPHAFMTLPKAPAAMLGGDLVEGLNHRLIAYRNLQLPGNTPPATGSPPGKRAGPTSLPRLPSVRPCPGVQTAL